MQLPACPFQNPEIVATQDYCWANKRSYGRIHNLLDSAISDLIRVIGLNNDPKTSTILNTQLERMTTRYTVVTKALHRQRKSSASWELHQTTVSALEHMTYALEKLEQCAQSTPSHVQAAYLALYAHDAKAKALEADARGAQTFLTKGPMSGLADIARHIRKAPCSPGDLLPFARLVSLARSIPPDDQSSVHISASERIEIPGLKPAR